MLKAYHMIGLPALAFGKLAREELAQAIQLLEATHRNIIASGALRPAASREQSRQFFCDHLAGDNQYVFLSLGRRYWIEPAEANFGFVFDAERLLSAGATLRTRDLLAEYEELFDEIVASFAPPRDPQDWTAQEVAGLEAALADLEGSDEGYAGPNDVYYNLRDAAMKMNWDYPDVNQVIERFKVQVAKLQTAAQLTDQETIRLARLEGETGNFEILVPGQLPVSLAIGFVVSGQTTELGLG